MNDNVSNADLLSALHAIGGGLHREFTQLQSSVMEASHNYSAEKINEAKLLTRELEELSDHIFNTKREIAMIVSGNEPHTKLGKANYELDAIVKSTEDATHNIMNAAEAIQLIAQKFPARDKLSEAQQKNMGEIENHIIKIFEHCNFQDITGQRINKVVKTLNYIEMRIANMIKIWGRQAIDNVPVPKEELEGDEALMNGPQMPGIGVSQTDIDQLFG